MTGVDTLFKRMASEPQVTVSGNTAEFDTSGVGYAAWDLNLVSINAGTVVFKLQRMGTDGIWYDGPATAALAAPGPVSIDISPSAARVAGQTDHMVFTGRARIAYTLAGGANAVVWSTSLMGRAL